MEALKNNTLILSDIQRNSLILYEKLKILSNNNYWRNYKEPKRNLKTHEGFIQKVNKLKEVYNLKLDPEILALQKCLLDYLEIRVETSLISKMKKKETNTDMQKQSALGTIHCK